MHFGKEHKFAAEINIRLAARRALHDPAVLVFRQVVICLDWLKLTALTLLVRHQPDVAVLYQQRIGAKSLATRLDGTSPLDTLRCQNLGIEISGSVGSRACGANRCRPVRNTESAIKGKLENKGGSH